MTPAPKKVDPQIQAERDRQQAEAEAIAAEIAALAERQFQGNGA